MEDPSVRFRLISSLIALENRGQKKSCYFVDLIACINLLTILLQVLFASKYVPHIGL